jgi:hypothetical protein
MKAELLIHVSSFTHNLHNLHNLINIKQLTTETSILVDFNLQQDNQYQKFPQASISTTIHIKHELPTGLEKKNPNLSCRFCLVNLQIYDMKNLALIFFLLF